MTSGLMNKGQYQELKHLLKQIYKVTIHIQGLNQVFAKTEMTNSNEFLA
jgi:hypothetical protein